MGCNPGLPPQFAILCEEGLFCKTSSPGAPGTCVPDTGVEREGPTYVDEGEECNGSLPPRFATLCKSGFFCKVSRLGSYGVCVQDGPEESKSLPISLPIPVGENDT